MNATSTAVPIQDIADRLEAARLEHRTIPQLIHEFPDLDLPTAYAIQAAGFQKRLDAGETLVGYKIGVSSRAKQRAVGVQEPIYAPLSSAMVHPEEAPLVRSSLVHPLVETEIAFLLGSDVDGDCPTVSSVLHATAGLLPAFEILDSRYDDFKFTQPDAVSDNASAARIVVGGRLLAPDRFDMQLEGMVMRVDGQVAHTGAGAGVAGHPALPVAWLARAVGGLKAGQIVLAGALAPAARVADVRGSLSAEFTSLGRLTLTVE
jgi:2-oxo-3-hexenedioate decarboxylase